MPVEEIKSLYKFFEIEFNDCFYQCVDQRGLSLGMYWRNIRTGAILTTIADSLLLREQAEWSYAGTHQEYCEAVKLARVNPARQFNAFEYFRGIPPKFSITPTIFEHLPDKEHYYQTVGASITPTIRWFNIANGSMLTRNDCGEIIYTAMANPGFMTVSKSLPFVKSKIWPQCETQF